MKILHNVGHNANHNLDSHYYDGVGDGFIFNAVRFKSEALHPMFQQIIRKYKDQSFMSKVFIDLQFYGKKNSKDIGELNSYDFHLLHSYDSTSVSILPSVIRAINFQIDLGITNIIIPLPFIESEHNTLIRYVRELNNYLFKIYSKEQSFYCTIPLSYVILNSNDKVRDILSCLTDSNIFFKGYYIVPEPKPSNPEKININTIYLTNLMSVFKVLNRQRFEVIYGFANWDSQLMFAKTDISHITIGTYEKQREFDLTNYTRTSSGGPSKGWYYSEKLLNLVYALQVQNLEKYGLLELISNHNNIYSDAQLQVKYDKWSIHNVSLMKNYLVSVSRALKKMDGIDNVGLRTNYFKNQCIAAKELYNIINHSLSKKDALIHSSSDYHLDAWINVLGSDET